MDTDAYSSEVLNESPSLEVQGSNDRIYVLGLAAGLIHYMLPETTIEAPEIIELLLKASMFMLLTLQLIIAFPRYSNEQKMLIMFLFLLVVAIGYSTTNWGTVYSLFALIVGAKGVDYRRILSVYYKMGAIMCISIVAMSLMGIIENKGFLSEGHGLDDSVSIRYCMGYTWPTDFASHVFFVLLSYWMLKKSSLNFVQIILFLTISYLVYFFSDSKLGTGCIILLILISIYMKVKGKLAERFQVFAKSRTLSRYGWVLYIPFMFIVSIWTVVSYDEGSLVWLTANMLLTGRLGLGHQILEKEGYALFGQEYELIGGAADANLYNYIDSSYLQSFIIYGVVFSAILALSYMKLASVAYNQKNYSFLYAILIAGLSGAIAQHFLQIFMNPLLIALTASNIDLNNETNNDVNTYPSINCDSREIDLDLKS